MNYLTCIEMPLLSAVNIRISFSNHWLLVWQLISNSLVVRSTLSSWSRLWGSHHSQSYGLTKFEIGILQEVSIWTNRWEQHALQSTNGCWEYAIDCMTYWNLHLSKMDIFLLGFIWKYMEYRNICRKYRLKPNYTV